MHRLQAKTAIPSPAAWRAIVIAGLGLLLESPPALSAAGSYLPAEAMTDLMRGQQRPLVAAHRGSTREARENTLAAIHWATTSGADLVEVDVRTTADGILVLMHDASVARTTSGEGRVDQLTLAELRRFRGTTGESVPTLSDAIRLLTGTSLELLLDVKEKDVAMAPRLVDVIRAEGFEHQVLVGVRSLELLAAVRRLDPEIRLLAMVPGPEVIADYLELSPYAVRLWARWALTDPALARSLRTGGVRVWITSGERQPDSLTELFPLADGFITDDPEGLRRVVDQRAAVVPGADGAMRE